ncbi:MAG: LLM class F420-dependent oxidoreductase [Gammaproteobacteria bacterium]|nr:LLM class F420-dependent oxidoreductase [Gammaproteobacteria bacterium]
MQIGAVLPHNEIGTDPAAIKAYAQGLEALGITHLLVYDHVLGADRNRPGGWSGPYDKDIAFHEPLTFHAFVAAVTTRLELVTTVLILPQRQAALVAKQAAEVALLSNNRLRLGIGTGWNAVEYEALNEDFSNRGKRQAEQVRLMRRLWREDAFSFEGDYHRVTQAGINPRPSRLVPIWFGGSAPALLRRCAELGDGWMPLGGPSAKSQACIDAMRAHREAAGRTWDGFGIQAQAQFAGGTPDRWRAHADKWRALGATHLAVATHNAGAADVDGHLARIESYQVAVAG